MLSFGCLTYACSENILTGPNGHCTLSKKEGALLRCFLQNKKQVLPRMTLLAKVWGMDAEVEEGNLDNYIYFVRRRLRSVGSTASSYFVSQTTASAYQTMQKHIFLNDFTAPTLPAVNKATWGSGCVSQMRL